MPRLHEPRAGAPRPFKEITACSMKQAMRSLLRLALAALLCLGVALPAQAAVTITFWSHELGNSFPHTFFTLRGTPDAGGAPVDVNYGFTAKSVSPALLFGTVPGRLDIAKPGYMRGSDAQFSVTLTDAQYTQMQALIAAWDDKTGDGRYNLNNRNCIHFIKEAARIAGLTGLDQPKLMKKPRSYLQAVAEANKGRVSPVNLHGDKYLQSLTPGSAAPQVQTVTTIASAAGQPVAAASSPTISTTSSTAPKPE
jgi:hypothetical protein